MAAEPAAHLAPAAEEQNFPETLRELWRRRGLIAFCTLVLGGAAVATAWSLPSFDVSEARVLVGVQAPRLLPNVEMVMADISPDAERVQNEGFIVQSRSIAKQVIDQLKLRDNPEFNPGLRKPSFWSRLNPRQYLPPVVDAWITQLTSATPKAADADKFTDLYGAAANEDRMIDTLLSRVDVSTLGRSYILSVKAESQNPATAAAIANTLAERYLDYQRLDKIGRWTELTSSYSAGSPNSASRWPSPTKRCRTIGEATTTTRAWETASTASASPPSSSASSTLGCLPRRWPRPMPTRGWPKRRKCARATSIAKPCRKCCNRP